MASVDFHFGADAIRINIPDRATLLARLRDLFVARQGFALATLNLDHLVKLRRSPAYRSAYLAHDLVVADGNPIVWLSRLAGRPVSLVPGSDMLRPVLALAADLGVRVAFVGASDAGLAEAATRLQTEIAGLQVVLRLSPTYGFDPDGDEAAAILARVAAEDVGLCILSLSAPRQEAFAARGRSLAPATGFAGFGAGLDFVTGTQVRAPVWMRRLALEWLWRAATSPRRLIPRYAACAVILPGLAADALRQRRQR